MNFTIARVRSCPHLIMDRRHYRKDGACRCDDPTHRLMKKWGYVWNAESRRWQ
jgi:hypothetical protein